MYTQEEKNNKEEKRSGISEEMTKQEILLIRVLERLSLTLMFGSGGALMPKIERKYCLISTSYLAALLTFSYYFIFDRIVCVLVTFYR